MAIIVVAIPRPAHANSTATISAYGGPGEIWVSGYGFSPGATVRVVALTNPGLKAVGPSQYTQADSSGNIAVDLNNLKYYGAVYVLADQLPPAPFLGTAGAQTVVNIAPQFLLNGTGQQSCGYPVTASIYGFQPYYNVRIELLSQDLTQLLDKKFVTSDYIGDAYASLGASGYTGWAWIIADEFGGYPPFPKTVAYHLYVC